MFSVHEIYKQKEIERTIEKQTVIPRIWVSFSLALKIPAHLHTAPSTITKIGRNTGEESSRNIGVTKKSEHAGSLRWPQRSSVRFLSESNVWQTWNTKRQAFNVKEKNSSYIRRFMGYGNQINTVYYYYYCEIVSWLMMRWQSSENTREIIIENHQES